MLPSLGIRNYRNLKSLDIERLARVNLVAGKNNSGKTSLLEAVSLYAAGGLISRINEFLRIRGEFYGKGSPVGHIRWAYASLFYNRKEGFSESDQVSIGPCKDLPISSESLTIQFAIMVEKLIELDSSTSADRSFRREWRRLEEGEPEPSIRRIALYVQFLHKHPLVFFFNDAEAGQSITPSYHNFEGLSPCQFVRTYLDEDNYTKWSKIALTSNEDYLLQALQIIEPKVTRFAYVEDDEQQKPIVLIDNERTPLRSMGDGINRILTIILSLIHSENGYLLIDEFENGLHHTVQEDLWKMIFKLAKELNVQVFATTHSDDCVEAFENVLNDGNQNEGLFIRLEKQGEVIKSVLFDAKELQVATDHAIEIR
ncbi:MAG: AAA family ATPase [Tunicatimonas sp.]